MGDVMGVACSTHKTRIAYKIAVFWVFAPITMIEAASTSVLLFRANQNLQVKDTVTR
jgi:hypothetical protein